MKINITGRKIDISDSVREMVEKKMGRLSKFFSENDEAKITLSAERDWSVVEVTIYAGGVIYRAEETNADKYVALDKIVDVIERQIRKNKTKLERRLRDASYIPPAAWDEIPDEEDKEELKIVKTKKHTIKPMSPEEAVLQMNLLGHSFFLFQNADTFETNIVYARKDGTYGLIETK